MEYKIFQDTESPIKIFNNDSDSNYFYLFESETEDKIGYQSFVEKHIGDILNVNLYLFKESSAGHGGSIDYLGIDDEGRIFLIEVKCHYDTRAKFDVIFQTLKYYLDPQSIAKSIFISNPNISFKENIQTNIKTRFNLNQDGIESLASQAYNNLKENHLNPIIVTDKATPQLISSAYSLVLRNTGSEFRVVELTKVLINGVNYIYSRKYFTNDDWVSVRNTNNRTPHTTKDERVNRIQKTEIKNIFKEVIASIDSHPDLSISWNSPNTNFFNLLYKPAGYRQFALGVEFYTSNHHHRTSDEHIHSGSIRFTGYFDLKKFVSDNSVRIDIKQWESAKHITNYFIINPDDVILLGSSKIIDLIIQFKEYYYQNTLKTK